MWLVLAWIAAACATASGGIHAVDGYWIGAEHECDPAAESRAWAVPCTAIVAAAQRNFQATHPGAVVLRAVLTDVPTDFTTPDGRRIQGGTAAGILTRTVVVLDLADGSRRVIGQMCHITHNQHGWRPEPVSCTAAPQLMTTWLVNPGGPAEGP